MGQVAAQAGDTILARQYLEKLRTAPPVYRYRGHSYQRSLISAALGEKENAVALLQQAFSEGMAFEPYLHREIEFQAMMDYAPLRDLLSPKT